MVLQIYTQMLSINYSFSFGVYRLLEEAPWADTWHRTSQLHVCMCARRCTCAARESWHYGTQQAGLRNGAKSALHDIARKTSTTLCTDHELQNTSPARRTNKQLKCHWAWRSLTRVFITKRFQGGRSSLRPGSNPSARFDPSKKVPRKAQTFMTDSSRLRLMKAI